MEPLVRLGFAIVLLLLTLSVAQFFLAGPLKVLRRTGAHHAVRRVVRGLWRGLVSLVNVLIRRRRPRVRRSHIRAPTTYFR